MAFSVEMRLFGHLSLSYIYPLGMFINDVLLPAVILWRLQGRNLIDVYTDLAKRPARLWPWAPVNSNFSLRTRTSSGIPMGRFRRSGYRIAAGNATRS